MRDDNPIEHFPDPPREPRHPVRFVWTIRETGLLAAFAVAIIGIILTIGI